MDTALGSRWRFACGVTACDLTVWRVTIGRLGAVIAACAVLLAWCSPAGSQTTRGKAAGVEHAEPATTRAQEATAPDAPTDLGPWLEEALASRPLPGIGAAVFDSQELRALGVAGLRKSASDSRIERGDLWHIGSLTKSFTTTLVGALVERGELGWDTKLSELLPEVAAGTPYADVTLIQLASHRSGLPANLDPAETRRLQSSGEPLPAQRLAVARALVAEKPVHAPGAGFLYSNGGYVVLGSALESLLGKPWEELVRAEVLEPLGLRSAGFGPPGSAGPQVPEGPDQPLGHQRRGDVYVAIYPGPWADNPSFLGPAGTLHLSIADLARYGREHLRGERGDGPAGDLLLDSVTFQRLHRAVGNGYGLGWVDDTRDWQGERRVIWHNGSNTLWYAFLALVPGSDLGVVVVSNGSIDSREAVEEIAAQLFAKFAESR